MVVVVVVVRVMKKREVAAVEVKWWRRGGAVEKTDLWLAEEETDVEAWRTTNSRTEKMVVDKNLANKGQERENMDLCSTFSVAPITVHRNMQSIGFQ